MNHHVKGEDASNYKEALRAAPPGSHPCPVVGCRTIVNQHNVMCKVHWSKVSLETRNYVYSTWNNGNITGSYMAARGRAISEAQA